METTTIRRFRRLAIAATLTFGLLVPAQAAYAGDKAPAPRPQGPSGPTDLANPQGGDDPRPEGPDDLANPEGGDDECDPKLGSCDIANPEGGEDECHPMLASCDITSNPGDPGDEDEDDPTDEVDDAVLANPTFTG